jgi:hypothetical protein
MAIVAMVTIKVLKKSFYLIVMKLHRNDPSDVEIYRTFKVQNFQNGNHGNHECSKDIFLSDCYETSQE